MNKNIVYFLSFYIFRHFTSSLLTILHNRFNQKSKKVLVEFEQLYAQHWFVDIPSLNIEQFLYTLNF